MKKDFLRNLDTHPLERGQNGEDTNPEPGKCNSFNHRKGDATP